MRSAYVMSKASRQKLQRWIEGYASKIVWLAAANRVLITHRHLVKRSQGGLLRESDVSGQSQSQVEDTLVASPLLQSLREVPAHDLAEPHIRDAYQRECHLLTGGTFSLSFGHGAWRHLIPAKAMFRDAVNTWMRVPDLAKGGKATLKGRAAERAVAVDLLKHQRAHAPSDLLDLKTLLDGLTSRAAAGST